MTEKFPMRDVETLRLVELIRSAFAAQLVGAMPRSKLEAELQKHL